VAAKKKADPVKPAKKKRKRTLPEETIKILNTRLDWVEKDLKKKEAALAAAENAYYRVLRGVTAADDDAEALMNAVRVLAAEVPSNTAPCRKARAAARQFLEARKIPPPSTLGASRNRPKGKKKKRS
jgi:hypothetical protein